MKKIGILTYHRAYNYGAFLQCYSLSQLLKTRYPNHKIEVIDFETRTEFFIRIKSIIKSRNFIDFIRKIKMFIGFNNDVKHYLPLSEKHIVSEKENVVAKYYNSKYDIIVVGSDAVWNNITSSSKKNFFLKGFTGCKKLSYAASCSGLDTNTFVIGNEDVKYSLAEFNYIGVREEKAERFIQKLLPEAKIEHNCDPTCFIELDKIDKGTMLQKLKAYGISREKPIFCLMTKNERVSKIIYEKYHQTHQLVGLYTYNKYVDVMLYDLSPMEFAVFFSQIDIMFSYFFHGAYLCLRNGKPVIAIEENIEPDNEEPKIKYLYRRLGLQKWYYRPNEMTEGDIEKMVENSKTIIKNDQSTLLKSILYEERKSVGSFLNYMDKIINS